MEIRPKQKSYLHKYNKNVTNRKRFNTMNNAIYNRQNEKYINPDAWNPSRKVDRSAREPHCTRNSLEHERYLKKVEKNKFRQNSNFEPFENMIDIKNNIAFGSMNSEEVRSVESGMKLLDLRSILKDFKQSQMNRNSQDMKKFKNLRRNRLRWVLL